MVPDVFNYTNYRKFIKDFYEFKKTEKKSFSYQYFATRAGFRSKTSLANITSGLQSLSKEKIYDVARAMKLGKKETEYFSALVHFNDAKSVEERKDSFERMQGLSMRTKEPRLIDAQFEYYSKWYHGVIRELMPIVDFKDDYKMLAGMVEPPITPKLARQSVELLLKLGMVRRTADGGFIQTDALLTSGSEVTTLALQKYHKEHLAIAAESIERVSRTLRDITSVTAGVSRGGLVKIIQEASLFRKKVMEIVEHDTPVETVYQIAVQIYPIAKTPRSWRSENE